MSMNIVMLIRIVNNCDVATSNANVYKMVAHMLWKNTRYPDAAHC